MPKASKETATNREDAGPVQALGQPFDDYTVHFMTIREDIDVSPLLHGLPDDRCQCPHWGYVIKGRITFRFADHDEVVEAGEAFYAPPGHAPVSHEPGTEFVQWSPNDPLRQVDEAIHRNLAAMMPS